MKQNTHTHKKTYEVLQHLRIYMLEKTGRLLRAQGDGRLQGNRLPDTTGQIYI